MIYFLFYTGNKSLIYFLFYIGNSFYFFRDTNRHFVIPQIPHFVLSIARLFFVITCLTFPFSVFRLHLTQKISVITILVQNKNQEFII